MITRYRSYPSWDELTPYKIADMNDIYDKSYIEAMTKLISKVFKKCYPCKEMPNLTYCRMYDKNDNPDNAFFYVAMMYAIGSRDCDWSRVLDILKRDYKLKSRRIIISGGPTYIYISPFYEWEDADFYLSIREDIYND